MQTRPYYSPEEEIELELKKKRKRLLRNLLVSAIVSLPILVLIILVVWNFPSIKKSYSIVRSEDFRNRAKRALEQNNLTSARIFLQNAARHTPDTPEVWDLFAELLIKEGSNEMVPALAQRFQKSPTLKNAKDFLQAAINTGNQVYAIPLLEKILDTFPTDASVLRLVALIFLGIGQLSEAENYLNKAIELAPTDKLLRLDQATLRLAHQDPKVAESAKEVIKELSANPDLYLPASRSLASFYSIREPTKALELYNQIIQRFPDDWITQIRRFQLICRLNPQEAGTLVGQIFAKANTVSQKAEVLSTVLTTFGPTYALDLSNQLTPEQRSVPTIAFIRIGALWQQGRFQDILQLANEGFNNTENVFERAVFLNWLHRVNQHLKQEIVANRYFEEMKKLANRDIRLALYFYNHFVSENEPDKALTFLEMLVFNQEMPQNFAALDNLYNYLKSRGDTANLLRIHERLLEKNPENAGLQNNVAAFLTLTGGDLNRALRLAETAYLTRPDYPYFISNYAHTLANSGRTSEALSLYNLIQEQDINDSIKLYFAHTLYLDGQYDKAVEKIAGLTTEWMLPEEKVIFEKIKKAASSTSSNTGPLSSSAPSD